MTSPLHDLVTGIIKQVINIKLQDFMGAKEVFKVSWMKIDRIGNIDAIVPEIDQTYPLSKGQDPEILVFFKRQ